ncbi:hypothetical protein ACTI_72320 [Actinoplanes sp. OR16]|uniref:GNAT family N-acetyltransferase n=1 Tax=Actinoplanes sp. OR16 TaxID=946334 RepID=UPI000F71AB46|nr:GNAT family N-acetyltransferase [Actinoplanes sp. OR16]BBH70547.1 hypothetical protein ACTI_72320 [Actinoplanes sp. OR16]
MPEIRPYRPSDLPDLYDICVRTAAAGGDARGHYSTDALMGDLFAAPYVHLEPALAYVLTADADPAESDVDGGAERTTDGGSDRTAEGGDHGCSDRTTDGGDHRGSDRTTDGGDHRGPDRTTDGSGPSRARQGGGGGTSGPSRARQAGDGGISGRVVGYVVGTADTAGFVRRYRAEWMPRLADRYPVPPRPPRTPEQEMHALHYDPERMLVPGLDGYPAHLHIDLLPPYQRRGHGRRLIERFLSTVPAPGVHVGMLTENVQARAFYDRLGFVELPVPGPGPLTYLGIKTM